MVCAEKNLLLRRDKLGNRSRHEGWPGDTANEHLQNLDTKGKQRVHDATVEVFESGCEPREWQNRFVIAFTNSSTKDIFELTQQRLISLLSHLGKTYRHTLVRRLRVILRAKLRDT